MNTSRKILIIRLSSLGDVILTTPIIRQLKSNQPETLIDFLVDHRYKSALETNENLNSIIEFDKEKNIQAIINKLKKETYDSVIDLQNNFRSRKITSGLGSNVLRFHKPTIKKFLLVKLKWNRFKELRTIPQMYADSISDFSLSYTSPEIVLPEEKLPSVKSADNFIGFAPGAKHFTKMWPLEYYIELGRMLNDDGYTILLLGGKTDKVKCSEIHNAINDSIDLCTNDDLLQIGRDMRECKVVVCNDSGLMHLAQSVNVPLISIFGSTVKEFGFFPNSDKSVVVENNEIDCRPCSHIGKSKCPKGHFKCMLDLTPNLLHRKIQKFVDAL